MQLRLVGVVCLVGGAGCLALAIVFLIGMHQHTHSRRVMFFAGSGIALVITGGILLTQALAQSKNEP